MLPVTQLVLFSKNAFLPFPWIQNESREAAGSTLDLLINGQQEQHEEDRQLGLGKIQALVETSHGDYRDTAAAVVASLPCEEESES